MPHSSLKHVDHRPWPLPRGPWAMAQLWSNLLFAHWRVPEDVLRSRIPEPLEIDTFDGSGWIGVVPFELRVRPRFLPVVPKIAAFPEINVRTYVTINGKPGVWFFSLDATSPLAVRIARWQFSLPYFDARMKCEAKDGGFDYSSKRTEGEVSANFSGFYGPTSAIYLADQGSLDAWLTERYCLYAIDRKNQLFRTDVHHKPWPLQRADLTITENSMTAPVDIELTGEMLLHFAGRIEVINWLPHRV